MSDDLLTRLSEWTRPCGTSIMINNFPATVEHAKKLKWERVGRSPKGLNQVFADIEDKKAS